MKAINDITLYDLMAEDLDVWICKNRKFGFNLEIENQGGEMVVDEHGIHPCAADSFASFCRQYLSCYERVSQQMETMWEETR